MPRSADWNIVIMCDIDFFPTHGFHINAEQVIYSHISVTSTEDKDFICDSRSRVSSPCYRHFSFTRRPTPFISFGIITSELIIPTSSIMLFEIIFN
jgi:hypothetical protein